MKMAHDNVTRPIREASVQAVQDSIMRSQDLQLRQLPIMAIIERKRCPQRRRQLMEFLQAACLAWSLKLLRADDLPLLSRCKALNALMRNASILEIPVEYLETDDFNSSFNGTPLRQSKKHPPDLVPTDLQQSVVHHSWLDLFPFPSLRDTMLLGVQNGQFDEEQLCDDFCCDLVNTEAGSTAALMIWGNSWDRMGWEFSEEFIRKWTILFRQCAEIFDATNYWRSKRGQEPVKLTDRRT